MRSCHEAQTKGWAVLKKEEEEEDIRLQYNIKFENYLVRGTTYLFLVLNY